MHGHFSPHLKLTKSYWEKHLKPNELAVDATCGNGHDTLFLAKLRIESIAALDIQPEAIENTRNLLAQHHLSDRVFLHHQSHEYLASLPLSKPPALIVYTLG